MIIRKHISILLALFILLVNSSATLVFHSCHDKIAYVSLNYQDNSILDTSDENSCCTSTTAKDEVDGCCSNQEIKVEKKIDYSLLNQLKVLFEIHVISYNFNIHTPQIVSTRTKENLNYIHDSHAPPFYKLYSQFVFYA